MLMGNGYDEWLESEYQKEDYCGDGVCHDWCDYFVENPDPKCRWNYCQYSNEFVYCNRVVRSDCE